MIEANPDIERDRFRESCLSEYAIDIGDLKEIQAEVTISGREKFASEN